MVDRERPDGSPVKVVGVRKHGRNWRVGGKDVERGTFGSRDAVIEAYLANVGQVFLVTYPQDSQLSEITFSSGRIVRLDTSFIPNIGVGAFTGEVKDAAGKERVGSFWKLPETTGAQTNENRMLLFMPNKVQ